MKSFIFLYPLQIPLFCYSGKTEGLLPIPISLTDYTIANFSFQAASNKNAGLQMYPHSRR